MAYRFKRKESIGAGVERILIERIQLSICALNGACGNIDQGIHEARKNFKKSRSLLRLIRSQISADQYQYANHFFRSASLYLSDARDAKVMMDTFDVLGARFPKRFKKHRLLSLGEVLDESVSLDQVLIKRSQQQAQEVIKILKNAPTFEWCKTLESHDFSMLEKGFKRAYQGGLKAMEYAGRRENHELFHDWRKRAKDKWYHTLLLRDCWPAFMRRRRLELKALTELLGDYNDLSVLCYWFSRHQNAQRDERFGEIVRLAQKLQQELKFKALTMAEPIYRQKPKVITHKVANRWSQWKQPC